MRSNKPIRCVQGKAEPHQPFWRWLPKNEAQAERELEFYGPISEYMWWGDEITPAQFKKDLADQGQGGPITLRIHSGGGDVFAASLIRAMLVEYPGQVTARIDGLCASAAVIVALAADVVRIQDTAYMMIHDPGFELLWGWLDIQTLKDIVDDLVVFKAGVLDTYETRTQLGRERLDKMMRDTTWMSASDAVKFGFADEVISGGKPAERNESVSQALQNFTNVPPALLAAPVMSAADQEFIDHVPLPADIELDRQVQALRDEIELYL